MNLEGNFSTRRQTRLSGQHEMDLDSGLKLHHVAVFYEGYETPPANRIGCSGCQHGVAANHANSLHRAILAHFGFQDDTALNVLLPCRLRILGFNLLE
jgi:hypothetical protein